MILLYCYTPSIWSVEESLKNQNIITIESEKQPISVNFQDPSTQMKDLLSKDDKN